MGILKYSISLSSNELEKSDQSIQDALDQFEDTDVIEANIGKEIGDEEILKSIFNADNTEQKEILEDSHEHGEDPSNKDKEIEYLSMPILIAWEEASKAARTKSIDSVGNEGDLLKKREYIVRITTKQETIICAKIEHEMKKH